MERIGSQWRFVFPTHAGPWSSVLLGPSNLKNGDKVLGHEDTHFEVRDVFVVSESKVRAALASQVAPGAAGVAVRYLRKPEADRRISRGDDFAGDAWLDTQTGETVYTVVGFDRNEQPTMIVESGQAVSTAGVALPDGSQHG